MARKVLFSPLFCSLKGSCKVKFEIPHSSSEVRQLELALDAYQNDINAYREIIESKLAWLHWLKWRHKCPMTLGLPISALGMVTSKLTNIPEEHRILIRSATARINDIANGLLSRSKASFQSIEDTNETSTQSHMLSIVTGRRAKREEI